MESLLGWLRRIEVVWAEMGHDSRDRGEKTLWIYINDYLHHHVQLICLYVLRDPMSFSNDDCASTKFKWM